MNEKSRVPEKLPPRNDAALGLFITDAEWLKLSAILLKESDIAVAAVFGSRQSGVRRKSAHPKPLDIDLAIELFHPSEDDYELRMMEVAKRIEEGAKPLIVQVEKFESSVASETHTRRNGVVVLNRGRGE